MNVSNENTVECQWLKRNGPREVLNGGEVLVEVFVVSALLNEASRFQGNFVEFEKKSVMFVQEKYAFSTVSQNNCGSVYSRG